MKIKILGIIIMFLCLFNSNIAYANENTEQSGENDLSTFGIEANYSSNITPLEGDVFEIIYGVRGETGWDNTATITVDASKIANETAIIEMSRGSYEIKKISYVGTNKGRNSYGIQAYFNVGTDDIISLTIGYETTKAGSEKWEGFIGIGLISDDYFMQQVMENPDITFEDLETEKIETETAENNSNNEQIQTQPTNSDDVYEEDDYYSDDYGVEIQGETDKEPEIEVHTTEETEDVRTENTPKPQSLTKNIIILCICIIILIVGGILVIKNGRSRR